jgi:chromosome segregation ATPase
MAEKKAVGRGLDALLNRHQDNKKRVDTLKLYKSSVIQAMSDGIFTDDEENMLMHLGNSLDIPEEEQEIIIGEALQETKAVVVDQKLTPASETEEKISKMETELKNLKIERDALAAEIKLLKEDEGNLKAKITELLEKVDNRNKEMKILRMENENLKQTFMEM